MCALSFSKKNSQSLFLSTNSPHTLVTKPLRSSTEAGCLVVLSSPLSSLLVWRFNLVDMVEVVIVAGTKADTPMADPHRAAALTKIADRTNMVLFLIGWDAVLFLWKGNLLVRSYGGSSELLELCVSNQTKAKQETACLKLSSVVVIFDAAC